MPRIFSAKALVVVGALAAGVALLLAAFHAFENWRGNRDWNAYRAAAEARGVKLGLDALATDPIPDAENFAAIPLFEEIFRAHEAGQPLPAPLELPKLPKRSNQPRLADRSRLQPSDLADWRDAFVNAGHIEDSSEAPARAVLRALERYEPVLTQLRDAAKRPRTRFPIQWERGFAAGVPHLPTVMAATGIFALRCDAHRGVGDHTAAQADIRDGLRLYRAMENEPTLVAGLVRTAMLARLEHSVWEGLTRDQWDAASLHELQSEFAGLRMLADYRRAFESERAGFNVALDGMFSSSRSQIAALLGVSESDSRDVTIAVSVCPRGWLRQNQRLINEFYDERLVTIDRAQTGWVGADPVTKRIEQISGSLPLRHYYFLVHTGTASFQALDARYLEAHTRAQQTSAACALARYRQTHGAYPESLSALAPEFLSELPTDIMDGAPLRYRQTADGGYELWSIGENRVDDHAAVDPKKAWNRQADWVWRP